MRNPSEMAYMMYHHKMGRKRYPDDTDVRLMNTAYPMLNSEIIPPPPPPPEESNLSWMSLQEESSFPRIRIVKNDYNQHYVDTGERPQNFIRDHEPSVRFTEYPKLARIIQLKDQYNRRRAHPPVHIKADLRTFDWNSLKTHFDVILIDPPWKEYEERATSLGAVVGEDLTSWLFEDMQKYLKVDKIAETPSFCFLWCGTSHLDEGRQLLQSWGFRRCEDICWCKMNKIASKRGVRRVDIINENGIFQRTTEHCLMGVKGLVKRSTDSHLIHSNIDTDVIIEEEAVNAQGMPSASTQKPAELYAMIERFCLGRRKIELLGLDRNIRPGWLTIGQEISVTNYDPEKYLSWLSDTTDMSDERFMTYSSFKGGRYVGTTPEIEQIRPKSPPRATTRHVPSHLAR